MPPKAKRPGLCSTDSLNRLQPFSQSGDFLQPADRPIGIQPGRLLLAVSRRNEEPARSCPRANERLPLSSGGLCERRLPKSSFERGLMLDVMRWRLKLQNSSLSFSLFGGAEFRPDRHFDQLNAGELVHFLGRSRVGWSSRNFSRMAAVCGFGDRRPSSQLRSEAKVAWK
jgi:hypothetical protein